MTNSQWDENAPGGGRTSLHHPPLLLRLLPVELLRWRRQVAQLQQEMLVFCILDIFISMLNARGPVAICTFDIQMNSSHAPCSEIKSFEIVNIISCINTHTHTERHHYLCNKKKDKCDYSMQQLSCDGASPRPYTSLFFFFLG